MREALCTPIKEKHTNTVLKGGENVIDLPVTRFQYDNGVESVLSVWKVPFFQRIKFLFDGRINFISLSVSHAPIKISIGEVDMKEWL